MTAQTPGGGLIYANDAAVEMLGYESLETLLVAPLGEIAGRFEMLDDRGRPLPVERLPGRRALLGRGARARSPCATAARATQRCAGRA